MEPYHNLTLPPNGPAHHEVTTAADNRALKQTSGNVRNGCLQSYRINKSKLIVRPQSRTNAKPSTGARSKLAKVKSQITRTTETADDEDQYIFLAHVSKLRRCTKAFIEYRRKQRPNKKTGELVWPDHVEEAFHEALDIIGAKGRTRTMYRGKSMGGNELISEYIKDRTGVLRIRKQISSHIQVLKKFNAKDPECQTSFPKAGELAELIDTYLVMAKVTAKDSKSSNADVKPYPVGSPQGMLSSNEQNVAYVSATGPTYEGQRPRYASLLNPHSGDLDLNASSSFQSRVLELDFKMWVEPRLAISMTQPQRHVYTELGHRNRCSHAALDDIGDWRSNFPKLASLEHRRDIDCEIILLETSFNFVSDYPPQNSTLGVQFQVGLSGQYTCNDWVCDTNIYTEGGQIGASSRSCPIKKITKQKPALPEEESADEDHSITVTPQFHSAFWSELFTKLMHKRASYDQTGDIDGLRRQAALTRKSIRGISAMQELYAVSSKSNSTPQRVAIFLWKFRQADPDEPGTTTWRNLIPPPSQILTNSSFSPELHSSLSLPGPLQESAIENDVNYVDSFSDSQLDMLDNPSTTVSEVPALIEGMEYPASSFAKSQDSGQVDTDFTGGHINLYFEPAPLDSYDDDAPCFSQPTHSVPRYEHAQHDNIPQFERSHPDNIQQYGHVQPDSIQNYEHPQADTIPQYEHTHPDHVPQYEHSQHDSIPQYEPPQQDSIQHYEQYEHTSWLNYGSLFADPNHPIPEPTVESMVVELS
ncbi:MAG: hypothetical protein M1835_004046 [Candelina submexicana]|nr:MAG: hypothetical protein M1835_004046 [Candelina submexicana]